MNDFFSKSFPFFNNLTEEEKKLMLDNVVLKSFKKNSFIHRGSQDCSGLILVHQGQLRCYINAENGKELTIYRLLENDICLFSATCILKNIEFEVFVTAEKDTSAYIIPSVIYEELRSKNCVVAEYTAKLMASKFSEVMFLIENTMFKSFDIRLANFLITERSIEETDNLKITHEDIANHLGTAREVVTRMLQYFVKEGIVELSRNNISILDMDKLLEVTNR